MHQLCRRFRLELAKLLDAAQGVVNKMRADLTDHRGDPALRKLPFLLSQDTVHFRKLPFPFNIAQQHFDPVKQNVKEHCQQRKQQTGGMVKYTQMTVLRRGQCPQKALARSRMQPSPAERGLGIRPNKQNPFRCYLNTACHYEIKKYSKGCCRNLSRFEHGYLKCKCYNSIIPNKTAQEGSYAYRS